MNEEKQKQTNLRSAVLASAQRLMARLSTESSLSRAETARWRHSLGRPMGDDPILYGDFLLQLEPGVCPAGGGVSPAEEAVWLAVQMFVAGGKRQQPGVSLGSACRMMNDDNIHRRLVIVENAPDFDQLREPLRAVIQLLSSGKYRLGLDYAALAGDLYTWHYDRLRVVRHWERDYAFEQKAP